MMKRIISCLLVCFLLLGLCPAALAAAGSPTATWNRIEASNEIKWNYHRTDPYGAPDEAMVRQRPAKEEKKKPLPREKSGQGNKAENYSSSLRTAMKASWGTSTLPSWRIRFLPSFCFSRSFFLRVISPP